MTGALTASLLGFCIGAEIAREVCFKFATTGADVASAAHPVMAALLRPVLWAGIVLWAIEVLAWIQVLQRVPLSLGFPIMTLTYVGVPAAGHFFLHERLSPIQWAGAVCVFFGVALVGLSGLQR